MSRLTKEELERLRNRAVHGGFQDSWVPELLDTIDALESEAQAQVAELTRKIEAVRAVVQKNLNLEHPEEWIHRQELSDELLAALEDRT